MRKAIGLTLILNLFTVINFHAQSWNWLYRAQYENEDYGQKIMIDTKKSIYAVSYHSNGNFQSGGGWWYYNLQKFDSAGVLLWVKKLPQCKITSAFVYHDSIYIHGSEVGSTIIPGQAVPPNGSFLLILDENGNFAAGNYITTGLPGGIGSWELGNIVFYDNSFYYAGRFAQKFAWGSDTLVTNNYEACILIKFDKKFNIIWTKQFPHTCDPVQLRLNLFSDKIYLSGNFKDTLSIDGYSVSASPKNNFLLCLDTTGMVQWLKPFGSSSSNMLMDHIMDDTGASYIAGYGYGSINYGTASVGAYGNSSAYLVKCDSNGVVAWLKQTPEWYSRLHVQNGKLTALIVDSINGDKLMRQMDLNGNILQLIQAKNVRPYDIKYNSAGSLLLTGGYLANSPFGPIAPSAPGCSPVCNFSDFFLLEMNDSLQTLDVSPTEEKESAIRVFPVPSSGMFTVSHPLNSSIKLVDLLGCEILFKQGQKNETIIDVSDQKKGIYILEVYTNQFQSIRKIIIE